MGFLPSGQIKYRLAVAGFLTFIHNILRDILSMLLMK